MGEHDIGDSSRRDRLLASLLFICALLVLGIQAGRPHGRYLLQVFISDSWWLLPCIALLYGSVYLWARAREKLTSRRRAAIAASLSLLFLLVLCFIFPLLGLRLLLALTALAVLAGVCGVGMKLCRLVLGKDLGDALNTPGTAAVAAALGLGALALGTFLMGLCGLTNRWPFLLLFLAIFLVGLKESRDLSRRVARSCIHLALTAPSRVLLAVILIGILTLMRLLAGIEPPLDYDDLHYHLALPKEFLQAERVQTFQHTTYSFFPLNVEMLHLWWLSVAGSPFIGFALSKMLSVWVTLLGALGVWGLTTLLLRGRTHSPDACAFAALLVNGMLWTQVLASRWYVEPMLLLCTAACALAFVNGLLGEPRASGQRWFLLCGLLVGLACGVKYPAILFLAVPVGLLVVLPALKRREWSHAWRSGALYAAGVLAPLLPYLVRNLVSAGNPFFPLLYSVFGGEPWTPMDAARFDQCHAPQSNSPGDWLRSLSDIFFNRGFGPDNWWHGLRTTPALLILLPLGFAGLWARGAGRRNVAAMLMLVCGWHLVVWLLFTFRGERYLYPAYALLIPAVMTGLLAWESARLRQWAARIILFVVVLTSPALIRLNFPRESQGFLGPYDPWATLRQTAPAIRAMEKLNDLPPDSKVMLVGEARTLYLERPHVYASPFVTHPLIRMLDQGPAGALEELQAMHVTHLYINWGEVQRIEETFKFKHEGHEIGGLGLDEKRLSALLALLHRGAVLDWEVREEGEFLQLFRIRTGGARRDRSSLMFP